MVSFLNGRLFLISTIVFLVGCVSQTSQFRVPEKVVFQEQTYVQVTANQIDEMQHLLYLPENSPKNTENWDKGILFFLDKNSKELSLDQRLAFRKTNFAKQPHVEAKFSIQHNELKSNVIYPPTERFSNIMLEVTRGRNLACGYGQIQFSDKREIDGHVAKKSLNLTAYQQEIMKLAIAFNQMIWQVECRE